MPTPGRRPAPIRVYLESGLHRVFACALDWPGWCRSGKNEEQALAALAASAPRYAVVATKAGIGFPISSGTGFDVVERLRGSATTDFGAPDKAAARDSQPLTPKEAERLARLVAAAWAVFDRVVAGAPAVLRKGPRGGGRDRDAIYEHVISAEVSYARKLEVRHPQPAPGDVAAVARLRDAILGALRGSAGRRNGPEKGWPARYVARRIAWHVVDHAWEIEDRTE